MASSFSEGERVRLFTLSLPESFQFFSMSERAAIGSYYSTVAPGTFLPQAFHGLRCLTWVNNGPRGPEAPLPVYPEQRTSSDRLGMSQRGQEATSRRFIQRPRRPPREPSLANRGRAVARFLDLARAQAS